MFPYKPQSRVQGQTKIDCAKFAGSKNEAENAGFLASDLSQFDDIRYKLVLTTEMETGRDGQSGQTEKCERR